MAKETETSSVRIPDDAIIIREAKPDLEEGLVFAQFFDEASEGFFKKMLGTRIYEIIADAFVKSNNEYSFENAIKSYEKFGMEIVSFWPNFLRIPPVFTRMVKEL